MLRIKKSHINNQQREQWIVYNPHNFEHHTHCYSLRVALLLRDNINHKRLPKTRDIRLLESHIRLTADKRYIEMVQAKIDKIRGLMSC